MAAVLIQTILAALIAGPRLLVGTEDTDLYHRYASRTIAGEMPYRDFLVEYPPLALPLFLGPALLRSDLAGFKVVFAVEMLLCNAACVWLVARWTERHEGTRRMGVILTWHTAFFAVLVRLIVTRYDAAPMLVSFAAALGWAAGWAALGGTLAAGGTFLKIYPATLALIALIGPGSGAGSPPRRWRSLGAFVLVATLGTAAWATLGGVRGMTESIRYQSDRGFEYGSLYSGGQMLAAWLVGAEIVIARDHSSFSSITPWSGALLGWVFPIQAAVVAGVGVVFAQRGRQDPIRASAAVILGFIAANKVFSPQFLIWLIPFVAVLTGPVGRQARWLFLATCAATLLAPGMLRFLPKTSLGAICAYNGRNLLVVWLLILLVFGPPTPASDPPTGQGG